MCKERKILLITIFIAAILTAEAVLNIIDERYWGISEADRYDFSDHPCRRSCSDNEEPKTCYYVFVVEQYSAMSKACYNCPANITDCYRPHCIPTDGVQKLIYTVNRQLPGPLIEVCVNDVIVVDVRNRMLSDSTTIHWHGFKQYGTPYMDGVPYVTQCPILPGQNFKYQFTATTTGTFFWHSHIGNQRGEGLFGPMIIHKLGKENRYYKLYDYDNQTMIVNDWTHLDGNSAEVKLYHDRRQGVFPNTILVNGHGQSQNVTINGTAYYAPPAVFTVTKNKRYRFRLIDAGSEDCPIEMVIDNHTMLVINLDSSDIQPVEVDGLTIWPGERIDFVLKANQKPGNYLIRYRGYGVCAPTNATSNDGIYQFAILQYDSVPLRIPQSPVGWNITQLDSNTTARVLNRYQTGTESSHRTNVNIPLLTSVEPNDKSLEEEVDQQVYLAFDFYPLDNYDFHRKNLYGYKQVPEIRRFGTLQLNHISLKLPSFPLLSQPEMIQPSSLCNSETIPNYCKKEQCACTHVINVELNSTVELIFVDEGSLRFNLVNHPFHLHGHFFRVVAEVNLMGNVTVEQVKQLDRQGKIKRRLDHAPMKDTMRAPSGGYSIVRFWANNPGYWFFHCHFDQHNNVGMALVFKVGEEYQFPPKPSNFPTCGNFDPND